MDIQTKILKTLADGDHLTMAEIAARLGVPFQRIAVLLYSARARGHVVRHEPVDGGKWVFGITRQGVTALTALDILQQRFDEKHHPERRQPPPDAGPDPQAERPRKPLPFIDPKFGIEMARTLHKSAVPLDARMRSRINHCDANRQFHACAERYAFECRQEQLESTTTSEATMIQHQQAHDPGTFAVCSGCKREPVHIVSRGVAMGEAVDFRDPNCTATRHFLECCRCGRSTARHPNLDDAVAEWGQKFAQAELKLRVVGKRRVA